MSTTTRTASGVKEDRFSDALTQALSDYLGGAVFPASVVQVTVQRDISIEVRFVCEIPMLPSRLSRDTSSSDIVTPPLPRRLTITQQD